MSVSSLPTSIDQSRLLQFVDDAFAKAMQKEREANQHDRGASRVEQRNRRRAKFWVEGLAGEFRALYGPWSDILVLSRGNSDSKATFGLNELLFDITVCRVAPIKTEPSKQLKYIAESLWAIESELAPDRHKALTDFSKLVLSRAPNKLFVGPFFGQRSVYVEELPNNKLYLDTIAEAAENCKGTVYLCQIPHPRYWDSVNTAEGVLYVWRDTWVRVRTFDIGGD